jgi:hypothetical protein
MVKKSPSTTSIVVTWEMNLLSNQSHDSLVYFSPISTFHVLVPIWYVCARFNLNCHFSHMLLLCYFLLPFQSFISSSSSMDRPKRTCIGI